MSISWCGATPGLMTRYRKSGKVRKDMSIEFNVHWSMTGIEKYRTDYAIQRSVPNADDRQLRILSKPRNAATKIWWKKIYTILINRPYVSKTSSHFAQFVALLAENKAWNLIHFQSADGAPSVMFVYKNTIRIGKLPLRAHIFINIYNTVCKRTRRHTHTDNRIELHFNSRNQQHDTIFGIR